ncbi:MAG TPA: glycosyltransferase, partial [Cytophagales bacterium]|nr:glycosyltransferase [Cytophagales bacterium]
ACDLIVHPTQGEAFPQIMVECMALEKVIAITRVSGATEHIVHMETGLILASKEVESITETIVHAFKTQEQLQEIGKRARKYVLEKLNLYKIIPKYEYLYKHLLK